MAIVKEIDLRVETDQARKDVQKLNKEVENVEKSSKSLEEQNKKTKTGFKGLTTGVRALGTALKAAGIGLIVAALAKVGELLGKNQTVIDTVNTAWTALGVVVKDVWNALMNFDDTIANIGDTIKNIIVERFKSALKAVNGFGTAILALVKGDFKLAGTIAKESLDELLLPGEEFTRVINGFKNYGAEVLETSKAYTELTNQSRLAEAQLRRVFEQSDRDAEIQRRIRDDFNLTAQERLDASEKLADILNKQEETQLRLAGLSVQRARQAIALEADNIENKIALINALAEQDAIEADIAGRRAEQEAQDRALRKEILDARAEEIGQAMDLDALRVENKKMSLDEEASALLSSRQKELEINQQFADANAEIARKEADAKQAAFDATADALVNLSLIAGKETAAGKALAIAAALISTYQGIAASLKEGGFFGIAQSIAVGAAGFAAVKNIVDTKVPGQSGSSSPSTQSPPQPQFNIVGQSQTNQLADVLNQDQEPARAYVVGSDVSTQQEMDRNIVETATIG